MNEHNAERHVIVAFAVLLLCFVGLTLFVGSTVCADNSQDSPPSSSTFHTNCAVCHGEDGGGSAVGKTLNVPDLRSSAVQKQTDGHSRR
jgi:cytochrome c553